MSNVALGTIGNAEDAVMILLMTVVIYDDSCHDGRGCYDDGCPGSSHPYHLHDDCHHSHRLHHRRRDCYHHLFLLVMQRML